MSKKLEHVPRISITTDIATVMNSTRSFIVLTMDYIGRLCCFYLYTVWKKSGNPELLRKIYNSLKNILYKY